MRLGSLKSVSLTSERQWGGGGGYEPGDGFAAIIVRQSSGPAMTESLILVSRHVWVDANLTLSRTPARSAARSAAAGGALGDRGEDCLQPTTELKKPCQPKGKEKPGIKSRSSVHRNCIKARLTTLLQTIREHVAPPPCLPCTCALS